MKRNTAIGKTNKAINNFKRFEKGEIRNIEDKDGNIFVRKPDEFFVPVYDKKYAEGNKKRAIGASRANKRKYISNYGNIISFERPNPKWIHGELTNKGRVKSGYKKFGSNEYIHRTEWFSFALDELQKNKERKVLKETDIKIYNIRTLNKIFDAETEYYVYNKNTGKLEKKSKSKYEVHHKDGNSLNNTITNLQLIKSGTHSALEGLNFSIDATIDIDKIKKINSETNIALLEKDGNREVKQIGEYNQNDIKKLFKESNLIKVSNIDIDIEECIKHMETSTVKYLMIPTNEGALYYQIETDKSYSEIKLDDFIKLNKNPDYEMLYVNEKQLCLVNLNN